jgi:signal peptidase II
MNAKVRLTIILSGGLFFFLDRLLKYFSTGNWSGEKLIGNYFGWLPSANHGIAFGLPVPPLVIIIASLPLIALVIFLFYKTSNALARAGLYFVLLGAVSNLFDRLVYGHTLDYFLVFISIFNLADMMIVAGVGLCLLALKKPDMVVN